MLAPFKKCRCSRRVGNVGCLSKSSSRTRARLARVPMVIQGAMKLPKVRLLEKGGGMLQSLNKKKMPVKTRDNSSTVVVLRASTHRDAVLDFGKVAVLLVPGFNGSKSCPITSGGPLRSNCQWCYASWFEYALQGMLFIWTCLVCSWDVRAAWSDKCSKKLLSKAHPRRHIPHIRAIFFTNVGLLCQWSKLQQIGHLTRLDGSVPSAF